MSAMKIKAFFFPGNFNTKVLCPPKVISDLGPTQGFLCCVHGPNILVAENILASLGSQPVQPDVIIQYVLSALKIAGASLCPAGATLTYFPVCPVYSSLSSAMWSVRFSSEEYMWYAFPSSSTNSCMSRAICPFCMSRLTNSPFLTGFFCVWKTKVYQVVHQTYIWVLRNQKYLRRKSWTYFYPD